MVLSETVETLSEADFPLRGSQSCCPLNFLQLSVTQENCGDSPRNEGEVPQRESNLDGGNSVLVIGF